MLKIYVYESRNTMIPVQGVNVQLQKEYFSTHNITDNEGKIVFNENWITTPAFYKLTLDNDPTWIFEYEITKYGENTFIYYEDERGVN